MSDNEFTRVYLETYKDLCLLALRYVHSASVAEDLVQEAFSKVLVRRPELFRPDDGSQVRAYMWRVVRNKSIDWCRKNAGRFSSIEERMVDSELSLLTDELIAPESFNAYDYGLVVATISDVVRLSLYEPALGVQTELVGLFQGTRPVADSLERVRVTLP